MLNRAAAVATAVMSAAAIAGCGSDPEADSTARVTATTARGAPVAGARAGEAPQPIALERAVGQRIITGYRGAKPTPSVLRAVRTGRVGGVILFGDNVPTLAAARAAIRSLKRAAAAGRQPPLLVVIDQEGGEVNRLASLPPKISPAQMGAARGPQRKAEAEGLRTGRALRRLGVNVDLAPVADVPDGPRSFLGTRAFSAKRKVVARGACGFAAGLKRGGVAASLKHFPGLGRARANTDLRPVRVEASRPELRADLAAYERCAGAVPMVMISSASYPALGIERPAVLDSRTYRVLAATGFEGITISDAFDTPAIANQTRPALAALKAGVDLLLYGSEEAGAQRAYARLLSDARAGSLPRAALQETAHRILRFKSVLQTGPKG